MMLGIKINGDSLQVEGEWEPEDEEAGVEARFVVNDIQHIKGNLMTLLLGYHKTIDFIEDVEYISTQKYLEQ